MAKVKYLLSDGICGRPIDGIEIEDVIEDLPNHQKDGIVDLSIFCDAFNIKNVDGKRCFVELVKDFNGRYYVDYSLKIDSFMVNGEDEDCYIVKFKNAFEGE